MLSVDIAAVRENDSPLFKGRQRKFTPDNIAKIKEWVAQGVGRDEIANRLEVTVNSLQVTCSRLGISLRKRSLANGNHAIQPLGLVQCSMGLAEDNIPARAKFALVLKSQDKHKAFDLPLRQDLIQQLALEAAVRSQSLADLIGTILSRVVRKDLVGELLHNGN
jgi:hypothetical protein